MLNKLRCYLTVQGVAAYPQAPGLQESRVHEAGLETESPASGSPPAVGAVALKQHTWKPAVTSAGNAKEPTQTAGFVDTQRREALPADVMAVVSGLAQSQVPSELLSQLPLQPRSQMPRPSQPQSPTPLQSQVQSQAQSQLPESESAPAARPVGSKQLLTQPAAAMAVVGARVQSQVAEVSACDAFPSYPSYSVFPPDTSQN